MDAVRFGPLVVPVQVALLLAGITLAHSVAAWFRTRRGVDPGPVLWKMIVFGFLAGRSIFVLRHHEIYSNAPLSIIDFRDGGFDNLAGFATAVLVGMELSRRSTTLRRPLLTATLTGCFVFFGGSALNHALTPVGVPVPTIEVRRLDNTTVPLSAFVGRPLIINLWATWCPPCRREMPVLKAAQLAHPEIHFVFANQGESAATVQSYLDANGLQMPNIVLDPAKQVSARTGSSGYPTTLFYDAQGRLYKRHMGELSRATLTEKIDSFFGSR
ncbi:TlpA family protein disulfide reductase [Cupriavidus gilardii]|nr:TlpA disulfide reductase family protein [Herminiimonas contaminans]MBO4120628.1 TlpA family protein disulfide reductase [Cupriavidus gilardii]MXN32842.1 redoxin family protein [Delftia sp. CH05]QQE07982.1 TlpA family protein disulfide reductase [Cupriavidus sp. ISTL7]UZN51461.1 TlpA family protein disulfide reductase [Cupriavidus cauae]MBF8178750.1 TlpA family protein disulfide reductase [Herminiimonas contaminans]